MYNLRVPSYALSINYSLFIKRISCLWKWLKIYFLLIKFIVAFITITLDYLLLKEVPEYEFSYSFNSVYLYYFYYYCYY